VFGFVDEGRGLGREVTQCSWLLSDTNYLLARENRNERQRCKESGIIRDGEEAKGKNSESG